MLAIYCPCQALLLIHRSDFTVIICWQDTCWQDHMLARYCPCQALLLIHSFNGKMCGWEIHSSSCLIRRNFYLQLTCLVCLLRLFASLFKTRCLVLGLARLAWLSLAPWLAWLSLQNYLSKLDLMYEHASALCAHALQLCDNVANALSKFWTFTML